jgi:hypothetical protein
MPKLTAQEKLERKKLLEEKREARRLAKEEKEQEKATSEASSSNSRVQSGCEEDNNTDETYKSQKQQKQSTATESSSACSRKNECFILTLSEDSLNHIIWFLSARDLGALTFTCRQLSTHLVDGRVSYAWARLNHKTNNASNIGHHRSYVPVEMCSNLDEARSIVEQSYGGGDTGRVVAKGKARKEFATDFVSYARFLQEAVSGYCTQNYGGKTLQQLPSFVNGRFVSASPEHFLCRVGGGGNVGAGGSGVAAWGIGKRGQLGNGKRKDEREPKMLLGGIGYNVRIVQVAAGGGLVRVAHSLFLTETGRVLSCGTGQYGALGHGYSGGKQLPDVLRPQYIEALSGVRCVCIAAGELHSAAVTVDGDLYCWGK